MRKILVSFALAAGLAAAQVPRAVPKAAAAAPNPATKTAPIPALRDLKFPALKTIPVPPVAIFTLPNGMKLYLLEDHELPLVSGTALIRTGNLFDPADKVGLATLTGMVMRTGGTKAQTGDQLNQELENMAATVESRIGETSGSVSFSALKEKAGAVMGIFHDVLAAPEFRQDKIDLAKMQLRSSIARRNDDAGDIAQREFANLIYGKDTPYGWQEQYATIARITRADLQAFHGRYFFPANVYLAVWGDFDTAAMKDTIEKLFADWTVQQPPAPAFPKVRTTSDPGAYLAAKTDVTQTFFAVGQLGGEMRDPDFPALEVMSSILGGGFQSRLFQRVRTQMGDAYSIGSSWDAAYDHPGLFQISGSTKAIATVETLKTVLEEVRRLRTTEVSEQELKTAKETALNSLVFAFDTRTKTLSRMLSYEYYGYPKDFIQRYQKALAAVTRADVLRVAQKRLDPASFTVVAVGNPSTFGQPLESLGAPVNMIDLTIPEQNESAATSDPASLAKGKEMLARAQAAVGGADKLAAIRDFSQSMEVRVATAAGGMQTKATDRWLSPRLFRQEQEISGRKIAVFYNGQTGWIAAPEGSGAMSGAQLKQVQGDLFRIFPRLLLSDRIQDRTVNAIDEQTVEISNPAGELVQLVIDPATGMPRKVRYAAVHAAGPPASVEDTWSDFREINGVKIPFKITISSNGSPFADVTLTDCKINSGLTEQQMQARP